MELFRNLAELMRVRRGKDSMRTTAKAIGISPTTLCKIENGHIPDIKTLSVICDWLGIQEINITGKDNKMVVYESKFELGAIVTYHSANGEAITATITAIIFTPGLTEYQIEWINAGSLNRFTVRECFLQ